MLARVRPNLAPPLSEEARRVPLPGFAQRLKDNVGDRAVPALLTDLRGRGDAGVSTGRLLLNLVIALAPAIVFVLVFGASYVNLTSPKPGAAVCGVWLGVIVPSSARRSCTERTLRRG